MTPLPALTRPTSEQEWTARIWLAELVALVALGVWLLDALVAHPWMPDGALALTLRETLMWLLLAVVLAAVATHRGRWWLPVGGCWVAALVGTLFRAVDPGAVLMEPGFATPIARVAANLVLWLVVVMPAVTSTGPRTLPDGDDERTLGWSAVAVTAGCGVVWWWWTQAAIAPALPVTRIPLDQALLVVLATVCMRGALLRPVVGMLAAVALDHRFFWQLSHHPLSSTEDLVTWGIPVLAAAALGSLAARAETRVPSTSNRRRRDLSLLAGVNALNVADALLTWLLLSRGRGVELNPIVETLTLPGKVALVAAGSWLVYRWRPHLLAVPMAALAVVLAYHLAGWALVGG